MGGCCCSCCWLLRGEGGVGVTCIFYVAYIVCFMLYKYFFSGKIDNLPICISFCGNRGDRPNPFNLLFHLNSSSGKKGGRKKSKRKKRRRTHDYNFNQINLQIRFNVFALIANIYLLPPPSYLVSNWGKSKVVARHTLVRYAMIALETWRQSLLGGQISLDENQPLLPSLL